MDRILFHQEYIETLRAFGEFRVFLRAPTDSSSEAKIIAIVFTKFENWGGKMVARHILTEDFTWAGEAEVTWQAKEFELRQFALEVYSRLRQR